LQKKYVRKKPKQEKHSFGEQSKHVSGKKDFAALSVHALVCTDPLYIFAGRRSSTKHGYFKKQ